KFEVAREKHDSEGVAVAPFDLDFFAIDEHNVRSPPAAQLAPLSLSHASGRSTGFGQAACVYDRLWARIERKTMSFAYICDAIRTPIGRYGGALAPVRTDDLAAIPIKS